MLWASPLFHVANGLVRRDTLSLRNGNIAPVSEGPNDFTNGASKAQHPTIPMAAFGFGIDGTQRAFFISVPDAIFP